MPPDSESDVWSWLEWQSELIEANAQLRSQAAANADTDKSSATIEPARIRLRFIPSSILRQCAPSWQLREIVCQQSSHKRSLWVAASGATYLAPVTKGFTGCRKSRLFCHSEARLSPRNLSAVLICRKEGEIPRRKTRLGMTKGARTNFISLCYFRRRHTPGSANPVSI